MYRLNSLFAQIAEPKPRLYRLRPVQNRLALLAGCTEEPDNPGGPVVTGLEREGEHIRRFDLQQRRRWRSDARNAT